MSNQPLPILDISGFKVQQPFPKLRTKFGLEGGDYVPFGEYDGYRTPAEQRGDFDDMEREDLAITTKMDSNVSQQTIETFSDARTHSPGWHARLRELLASIPRDLHLADATTDEAGDTNDIHRISELFWALAEHSGIGYAVAGKILCRKRPRSIPMLGSWVGPFTLYLCWVWNDSPNLRRPAKELETLLGRPRNQQRPCWQCPMYLQTMLEMLRTMCREGREQLETLCTAFDKEFLPGQELAPLRALEALLWWEVSGRAGQYVDSTVKSFWQVVGRPALLRS